MNTNVLAENESKAQNEKLNQAIDAICSYYAMNPFAEPSYTLPQIFNKQNDENFISDWLAYLLNPSVNGWGLEPLRAFCEPFDVSIDDDAEVTIIREYAFKGSGRRPDIIIRIDKAILICIENKLWATETSGQTKDYAKQIKIMQEEQGIETALCIFLLPENNKTIPASRSFKRMTYSEVLGQFKNLPFDINRNQRKNFYLYEFLLYIEEYLQMENTFELTEAAKIYMENRKEIEQAAQEFRNFANEIDLKFADDVLRKINNDNEFEIFKANPKPRYIQIYKSAWMPYGYHFEILIKNNKRFCELHGEGDMVVLDIHCEGKRRKEINEYFNKNGISIEKNGVLLRRDCVLNFSNKDVYDASLQIVVDIFKSHEYQERMALMDRFVLEENKTQ